MNAIRQPVILLGIPIDTLDLQEALAYIEHFINDGRAQGNWHQVISIHARYLFKASRDPELRQTLQSASLLVGDGWLLSLGARLLGAPIRSQTRRQAFLPALAARAAQCGWSLCLLRAGPGEPGSAARWLQQAYPNLKVSEVNFEPRQSSTTQMAAVLNAIRAATPDILLVGLGQPAQEQWIRRFGPQLQTPVVMGAGDSLNRLAGVQRPVGARLRPNQPAWIRQMITRSARRLKRHATDLFYLSGLLLRQFWAMRQPRLPSPVLPMIDLFLLMDATIINVHGPLSASRLDEFYTTGQRALITHNDLIINLEHAAAIDSAAIGALVGLAKEARAAGRRFSLTHPPRTICDTLRLMRLDTFFTIYPDLRTCLADRRKPSPARLTPVEA